MILQAGLGLLFILKHIDRLSSEYLFLGASHVVQNETLFVFVSTYKTPLFLKKNIIIKCVMLGVKRPSVGCHPAFMILSCCSF